MPAWEIGGPYTATVAAAMNMMGNFAGFVAPVLGGFILLRTGGDWNPLIYLMIGAAMVSALSWIYLDPQKAFRKRATNVDESLAQISADNLKP
jgi:MFS transporter, ACS family, glucarate transporter